jgi:drug/metabolite transporter (DMT)-like permease
MSKTAGRGWLVLYLALGLIWGSSFFLIHEVLHAIPPIGMSFWRCALGALTMLAIVLLSRTKIILNLKSVLLIGAGGMFMNGIPWMLFGYAQSHVTSILASIINGATPIMTLIALMTIFRSEKVKLHVIIGILIGAVGLMIALAAWQGFGENDPLSIAALGGAIACYGIGGPYIRKYVTPLGVPNTVTSLVQLGVSTVFVLPFYLFTGPLFVGEVTASIAWAMFALGAVGSGIAYVFYYRVIAEAGSAIANTVTYITPLVAVFLGVLVLGEPLYWYEPVGAVVVILGAAISQGYLTRKARVA